MTGQATDAIKKELRDLRRQCCIIERCALLFLGVCAIATFWLVLLAK